MTKRTIKQISERYTDCKELSRIFEEDGNELMEHGYWYEAHGIEEAMNFMGYEWDYATDRFVKAV